MRRIIGFMVIMAGLAAPVLEAQSLEDQVNFKSGTLAGLHLNGVSVYSGYSTYPLVNGLSSGAAPGGFAPDANYGASVSVSWQHHREKTDFSMMYSGGYGGMVRDSDTNGFNNSLTFSGTRQLRQKWTFSFSGSGQDSTLAQFLFQPSALSVISQVPATFDDLAAAFALGRFTDNQVASMLSGAPLLDTPARSLLAGNRILSYGVQTGLSYAPSARLRVQFTGVTAAGQSQMGGVNGEPKQTIAMPHTMGINGGVSLSYALSPRTQVSASLDEHYVLNAFQTAYVSDGTVSFGRKMGRHWFVNLYGGGSKTQMQKQVYGSPSTTQAIGGGSIGIRTYQHTLIGSYSRTSADTYGLAAGVNTMASGSWSWRRPGSRWSTFASMGQQQMKGNGFADLSGWMVSGGVTARLNPQTTVTGEYTYFANSGTYLSATNNLAVHSIRVSLAWSPQASFR
jgi:hypothetical protein